MKCSICRKKSEYDNICPKCWQKYKDISERNKKNLHATRKSIALFLHHFGVYLDDIRIIICSTNPNTKAMIEDIEYPCKLETKIKRRLFSMMNSGNYESLDDYLPTILVKDLEEIEKSHPEMVERWGWAHKEKEGNKFNIAWSEVEKYPLEDKIKEVEKKRKEMISRTNENLWLKDKKFQEDIRKLRKENKVPDYARKVHKANKEGFKDIENHTSAKSVMLNVEYISDNVLWNEINNFKGFPLLLLEIGENALSVTLTSEEPQNRSMKIMFRIITLDKDDIVSLIMELVELFDKYTEDNYCINVRYAIQDHRPSQKIKGAIVTEEQLSKEFILDKEKLKNKVFSRINKESFPCFYQFVPDGTLFSVRFYVYFDKVIKVYEKDADKKIYIKMGNKQIDEIKLGDINEN